MKSKNRRLPATASVALHAIRRKKGGSRPDVENRIGIFDLPWSVIFMVLALPSEAMLAKGKTTCFLRSEIVNY